MAVVETLRGIMDGFDPFYGTTQGEESDDARKKALGEIVRVKGDGAGAKGREATSRLIDVIVSSMRETKPISPSAMTDRLLGVFETNPAEVEKVMRRKILGDRLDKLATETADHVRLRPAKKSEEWGSHDLVFDRAFDDWDVTLGYFPEYIRHRAIYGQMWTSPLINKSLAVSVRYHRTEHHLVPQNADVDRPGLLDFLKGAELDRLAKTYGITYELPALGNSPRSSTHTAKGGYKVMVETLENELRNSPYSAEKLIRDLSTVSIFYEDPGISFHLIAEFPKGHPDIGQNLALVFGADLFKLTKQQWDEFKKVPPVGIAALETLKN